MKQEIANKYKDGKFSPLDIEMAKAKAFCTRPMPDYIWFNEFCKAQANAERIILNLSASTAWPNGAAEVIKGTIIDMTPPKIAPEADANDVDLAALSYADWLLQVTRQQDIIVVGRDVSRALCSRILPILENNSRKCVELVTVGDNFFSFRRL